jgi:hypothetical protein
MATLSASDIDELTSDLLSEFSGAWTDIPVNRAKFRAGLVDIDAELDTAETTIFAGIGDAEVKSWLQANQTTGRLIVERTERKRKEAL